MINIHEHLNQFRLKSGPMESTDNEGLMGCFLIPTEKPSRKLWVISSGVCELSGWEHVSAHVNERTSKKRVRLSTPTWDEMCFLKSMFWDDKECVIQFHPSKSEYVNCHEHTLHLWKPINQEFPIPNKILVGPI